MVCLEGWRRQGLDLNPGCMDHAAGIAFGCVQPAPSGDGDKLVGVFGGGRGGVGGVPVEKGSRVKVSEDISDITVRKPSVCSSYPCKILINLGWAMYK